MVKSLPAMQETRVRSLGGEDPLKEGIATHASILVWRIPWIEEPGGLQSIGLQRVGHDWRDLAGMHIKRLCYKKLFVLQFLLWFKLLKWNLYLMFTAKSLQSCPTLCDPIDGSPPGSHVPGILQARTLEWVAISFSNAWKWKVRVKLLSRVQLLATPWTAAYQAPPSMGFSRQEYWSGVPLLSPID